MSLDLEETQQSTLPFRNEAPALKRRSVRTGCLTCKIRRVKCDETKPNCNRCSSTGRTCDGYPPILPRKRGSRFTNSVNTPHQPYSNQNIVCAIPRNPDESVRHDSDSERRSYTFFIRVTGQDLLTQFYITGLYETILQLSHINVAIRSAMVALGSLGERLRINSLLKPSSNHYANASHEFARWQYGKSMRFLHDQITSSNTQHPSNNNHPSSNKDGWKNGINDTTERQTIITCFLFAVFEFMQGNGKATLLHVTSGNNILSRLRPTNLSTPYNDTLLTAIKRTFSILINQAVLWLSLDIYPTPPLIPLGKSIPPSPSPLPRSTSSNTLPSKSAESDDPPNLTNFNSLSAASYAQNYQRERVLNFRRLISVLPWHRIPGGPLCPMAVIRQKQLMTELEMWPAGLTSFLASEDEKNGSSGAMNLTLEESHRVSVMYMNNTMTRIMLGVALIGGGATASIPDDRKDEIDGSRDEGIKGIYTPYTAQFQDIVSLAAGVLHPKPPQQSSSSLSSLSDSYNTNKETQQQRISRIVRLNNVMSTQDSDEEHIFKFYAGLAAPLSYVAMKCVEKSVCEEAVDLLKREPWREGAWDSWTMGEMGAERIRGM